ncbi:MAG: hypothetical protein JWM54_503 [Acidobacteriaceae bacterium]|jgi:hypothetical protein|nr:hypothetical protein [Acidobacteriaceae bacterium]
MPGFGMRGGTLCVCRPRIHVAASVERLNPLQAGRWLLPLNRTEGRFNAAELGLVKVTRYPGFHIARATLHTRQIQQHTSLGLVDEMVLRQFPVR